MEATASKPQKRKRKSETAGPKDFVTFVIPEHSVVFDRVFEATSLGELKETVRQKLKQAANVEYEFTHLRGEDIIALEDDYDFEGFAASTRLHHTSRVRVKVAVAPDRPSTSKAAASSSTATAAVPAPKTQAEVRQAKRRKIVSSSTSDELAVETILSQPPTKAITDVEMAEPHEKDKSGSDTVAENGYIAEAEEPAKKPKKAAKAKDGKPEKDKKKKKADLPSAEAPTKPVAEPVEAPPPPKKRAKSKARAETVEPAAEPANRRKKPKSKATIDDEDEPSPEAIAGPSEQRGSLQPTQGRVEVVLDRMPKPKSTTATTKKTKTTTSKGKTTEVPAAQPTPGPSHIEPLAPPPAEAQAVKVTTKRKKKQEPEPQPEVEEEPEEEPARGRSRAKAPRRQKTVSPTAKSRRAKSIPPAPPPETSSSTCPICQSSPTHEFFMCPLVLRATSKASTETVKAEAIKEIEGRLPDLESGAETPQDEELVKYLKSVIEDSHEVEKPKPVRRARSAAPVARKKKPEPVPEPDPPEEEDSTTQVPTHTSIASSSAKPDAPSPAPEPAVEETEAPKAKRSKKGKGVKEASERPATTAKDSVIPLHPMTPSKTLAPEPDWSNKGSSPERPLAESVAADEPELVPTAAENDSRSSSSSDEEMEDAEKILPLVQTIDFAKPPPKAPSPVSSSSDSSESESEDDRASKPKAKSPSPVRPNASQTTSAPLQPDSSDSETESEDEPPARQNAPPAIRSSLLPQVKVASSQVVSSTTNGTTKPSTEDDSASDSDDSQQERATTPRPPPAPESSLKVKTNSSQIPAVSPYGTRLSVPPTQWKAITPVHPSSSPRPLADTHGTDSSMVDELRSDADSVLGGVVEHDRIAKPQFDTNTSSSEQSVRKEAFMTKAKAAFPNGGSSSKIVQSTPKYLRPSLKETPSSQMRYSLNGLSSQKSIIPSSSQGLKLSAVKKQSSQAAPPAEETEDEDDEDEDDSSEDDSTIPPGRKAGAALGSVTKKKSRLDAWA